ncbi:MAG: RidA family protein [Micrococcales bacterium]|nr:RidA family protein [Micrococcales bacterium]
MDDSTPTEPSGQLPPPPGPQGRYVPAIEAGGLVVTAGMTPRVDGVLTVRGTVGRDVSVREARQAAAIAARNALAAATEAAGSAGLRRLLRLTVYVRATPDFLDHSAVADGASEELAAHLGDAGAVVRSAVGVASLPGGACVEVELTALASAS